MKIRPPLLALFAALSACSGLASDPGPTPQHQESVGRVSSAASEPVTATLSTYPWFGRIYVSVTLTNTGSQPTTTWTVSLTGFGTFGGDIGGGGSYTIAGNDMAVSPGPHGNPVVPPGGHASFTFAAQDVPTIVWANATTGPCGPDTCLEGCCYVGTCYTFETPPYCGIAGNQCTTGGSSGSGGGSSAGGGSSGAGGSSGGC